MVSLVNYATNQPLTDDDISGLTYGATTLDVLITVQATAAGQAVGLTGTGSFVFQLVYHGYDMSKFVPRRDNYFAFNKINDDHFADISVIKHYIFAYNYLTNSSVLNASYLAFDHFEWFNFVMTKPDGTQL